jgi:hypothetical protein
VFFKKELLSVLLSVSVRHFLLNLLCGFARKKRIISQRRKGVKKNPPVILITTKRKAPQVSLQGLLKK